MKLNDKCYFVRKESPKQRDYRFNYQRTPESALNYYVGEYWMEDRQVGMSGTIRHVKTFHKMATFKTREEAQALADKWNNELTV